MCEKTNKNENDHFWHSHMTASRPGRCPFCFSFNLQHILEYSEEIEYQQTCSQIIAEEYSLLRTKVTALAQPLTDDISTLVHKLNLFTTH